jgi:AAA15 family ATPase/GTPase
MICRISLNDYRFFGQRSDAELDLVASRQTYLNDTLLRPFKGARVLRKCAIYGAGGSGKTRFIEGIGRAMGKICNDLDSDLVNFKFGIWFAYDSGEVYSYDFWIDSGIVALETLTKHNPGSRTVIFKRDSDSIQFSDGFAKKFNYGEQPPDDLLSKISKNRLLISYKYTEDEDCEDGSIYFLSEIRDCLSRSVVVMSDKYSTHCIESGVQGIFMGHYYKEIVNLANQYDFMIDWIGITECGRPGVLKHGDRCLTPFSSLSKGELALLNVLFGVSAPKATVFIDDFDSHLHPLVSEYLVRNINYGNHACNQLVFTTNNLDHLESGLFRRDELCFFDKDKAVMGTGYPELISFSQFEGLNLKSDLRKMYALGRFGGTPKV